MSEVPRFVRPHEGIELKLMRAGTKPLSMFDVVDGEDAFYPEEDFEKLVADGRLVRHSMRLRDEVEGYGTVESTRTLYALPSEAWRISAMLHVISLYEDLGGWRDDLERVTGSLLGYDSEDIENWLAWRARQVG